MHTLMRLVAVALAATLGTAALAASAWSAGAGLASVPLAWWGAAQIAQMAIVIACGLGAAGGLWHLASAGLALAVVLESAPATADARGASAPVTSRSRAGTVLQRWGAPLVRRIATGAMIAGLTIAPAAAAAAPSAPDDLGWQVTSGQDPAPRAEPTADPGTESARDSGTGMEAPDAERPEPASSAPGAGAEDPDPPTAPSTGGEPGSSTTHIVEPGESLWSITAIALGPGATDERIMRTWPLIYEANTERIGPDPSVIHPGASLRLPDAPGRPRAHSADDDS